MNRRDFLTSTSAGLLATRAGAGRWLVAAPPPKKKPNAFPSRSTTPSAANRPTLCTIYTLGLTGTLRCDPHPCWSRNYKQVCFNGAPEGRRQVFVADLAEVVAG